MKRITLTSFFALTFVSFVSAQFGTIYSKNSWTDNNDFTANGNASATLSGSYVNISSATTLDRANTIYVSDYVTKLSKWRFKARFKIVSFMPGSYGIGFGVSSINPYFKNDICGFINTSSTTGTGGLHIIKSDIAPSLASGPVLGVALNDIIDIEAVFKDSVFTFTANNVTSGAAQTLSYTYVWDGSTKVIPNTCRFSIMELGGVHEIRSIEITSDEKVTAKIAVIGDSKTAGYFATSFAGRYAAQMHNMYNATVINAGGGDRIVEVLARKTELERLDADKYLLNIGSNDFRLGRSMMDIQADYDSLVRILQATGASVYHIVMPEDYNKSNATDMSGFRTWVATQYNSFYISGVWDSLANGNLLKTAYDYSDGIHLNQAGNDEAFEAIVASNKLNSGTLPVKLYSFDAKEVVPGRALISWEADPAEQAEIYTILKSNDGEHFNELYRQQRNNSGSYQYTDAALAPGKNYFKLKMIEADNTVTYSRVVAITGKQKNINAANVKRVGANEILLEIKSSAPAIIQWQVVDVAGRVAGYGTRRIATGSNSVQLSVPGAGRDIYFLRIVSGNDEQVLTVPLMK